MSLIEATLSRLLDLQVYGRNMLLCDCDDFTKEYYRANYGVEDFTPVQLDEVQSRLSAGRYAWMTMSLCSRKMS
jgi:hypothetical protein